MRNISLLKNSGLSLLCIGLFVASLLAAGCSKPEKKATPEEKKKVVTEMNIQSSGDTQKATPKENAENAVESLPFESEVPKEEELPILGSGG